MSGSSKFLPKHMPIGFLRSLSRFLVSCFIFITGNVRKRWPFPMSFYKRASRCWGRFRQKVAPFCFCFVRVKMPLLTCFLNEISKNLKVSTLVPSESLKSLETSKPLRRSCGPPRARADFGRGMQKVGTTLPSLRAKSTLIFICPKTTVKCEKITQLIP